MAEPKHTVTGDSYKNVKVYNSESTYDVAAGVDWDGVAALLPQFGPALGKGDLVVGSIIECEWLISFVLVKGAAPDVLELGVNVFCGDPEDPPGYISVVNAPIVYRGDGTLKIKLRIQVGTNVGGLPIITGYLELNAPSGVDADDAAVVLYNNTVRAPINNPLVDTFADPLAFFVQLEEIALTGTFVAVGQLMQVVGYTMTGHVGQLEEN